MTTEKIAWDSCIIIDAIQKEPERWPAIEPMARRAESGDLSIVVSTVSLAEVVYLREFATTGMSQADQDDLIKRWFDNDYVYTRNADIGICEEAAKLGRAHRVTPLDSIILATAVLTETKVLVTYDDAGKSSTGVSLLDLDSKVTAGRDLLRIVTPENIPGQREIQV